MNYNKKNDLKIYKNYSKQMKPNDYKHLNMKDKVIQEGILNTNKRIQKNDSISNEDIEKALLYKLD